MMSKFFFTTLQPWAEYNGQNLFFVLGLLWCDMLKGINITWSWEHRIPNHSYYITWTSSFRSLSTPSPLMGYQMQDFLINHCFNIISIKVWTHLKCKYFKFASAESGQAEGTQKGGESDFHTAFKVLFRCLISDHVIVWLVCRKI